MTDNRVLVSQDGTESVWCHRGDGWGITRLKEQAVVTTIVISTEANPVVERGAVSSAWNSSRCATKGAAVPLNRRLETRNFTCGKVALGERLHYGFPRDWIHIDWANADYCINLAEAPILPLKNNTTGIIFSAHLIEHLPPDVLLALLGECYRILKPGGRIRVECPDTEKLVDLYRRSDQHMLTHFRKCRRELIVEKFGYSDKYLEDHLSVLGEVANYIVPGQGVHIPVYASKEEFDAKLDNLDLESFAQWRFSSADPRTA